ncbi:nuclear transport factor 2 family protein [Saccharothrix luteola]|uniref:nuclear transport factor 2 family protein n=1 Tax=Saccharothrix luteola TaxID=2893018 RepID=UPI001E2DD46A|nr:nuclear transport factor 2 family protein [Saccharothrix luteola]MCC8243160.1 nuclear transport factor 2 family protein [Saccharothrix luteola]
MAVVMGGDDRTAVEQFYADQVHALDRGDFDAYGDTFDADAEFVIDGLRTLRGRARIVEHSQVLRDARSARGAVQRHFMANCAITSTGDDIRVRGTVLAVESVVGQGSRITGVIEFADLLRVQGIAGHRVVSRTAKPN